MRSWWRGPVGARVSLGVTLALASACGGKAASRPGAGDAGSDGAAEARDGAEGGEAGAGCELAASGAFTFHVHNAGTATLLVDLGCGATSPLALETPDGTLGAGPGNVDNCGFSCDDIYAGRATPGGCTDCGGSLGRTLGAGATIDLPWDRRVYVERAVAPSCSAQQGTCAFGIFVAPAPAQKGTLTTCPMDQHPTSSCLQPLVTSFQIDTTGAAATIEVGP